MPDKRIEKTQEAVKEALLEIMKKTRLSQITVSGLANEAGISRSTFYANFQNVNEVFEMLIVDFMMETRALVSQLRCKGCEAEASDDKTPYCIAVRTTDRYRNVVREAEFLPTLLQLVDDDVLGEFVLKPYLDLGVSPSEAKTLLIFQIAGCHTAALSCVDDSTWRKTQSVLDTFIAGGMKAVRQ